MGGKSVRKTGSFEDGGGIKSLCKEPSSLHGARSLGRGVLLPRGKHRRRNGLDWQELHEAFVFLLVCWIAVLRKDVRTRCKQF
jgi:hypothetical protein